MVGFVFGVLFQKLKDALKEKEIRKDAIKRSRATLGGQFSEQIAPYLPSFPCNAGDARFLGKPIDFVAFPGSAEGRKITEVLFIEVKSGQSKPNEREYQIKSAIEKGHVRYIEYRIPQSNK